MKALKPAILALTLLMTLAACHNGKSKSTGGDGVGSPFSFHKTVDCPAGVIGTWSYQNTGRDGAVSNGKFSFEIGDDLNLSFTRLSQENEAWDVNGYIRKYPSGQTVSAYCESGNVVIQVVYPDRHSEAMVFTPGKDSASMSFKDIFTLGGSIDHATLAVYIADASYPRIQCTQMTP